MIDFVFVNCHDSCKLVDFTSIRYHQLWAILEINTVIPANKTRVFSIRVQDLTKSEGGGSSLNTMISVSTDKASPIRVRGHHGLFQG